jgi:nicotinamidase-related amidase
MRRICQAFGVLTPRALIGREYMKDIVLLIVDVQTYLINERPYNVRSVIGNIKRLILAARDTQTEVIYVRHDGGEGDELEYGTEGWQICGETAPDNGETIFDKRYNSAFLKTGLSEYLAGKSIHTIVLAGLQTEYCMDATCKSAFEHGFNVIIPELTNTTFDNDYLSGEKLYEFYNYKIWNKRFADVMPVDDVIKILSAR